MKKFTTSVVLVLILFAIGFAAPKEKVFTGQISDSQCALNVHSTDGSHDAMLKVPHHGDSAADCARMCVRGQGGRYVLVQAKTGRVFKLDAQDKLESFAGQRVTVRGTLDSANAQIQVTSVQAAQ